MLGGGGRREGRGKSQDGGALAPAELSSFFSAFPVFKKTGTRALLGAALDSRLRSTSQALHLNWWGAEGRGRVGQRGRRAKERIYNLVDISEFRENKPCHPGAGQRP